MCSILDNYTLVEETKFLNNETEIEKYYKKNEDNISSVKLINYNNDDNVFTVLINYNNKKSIEKKAVVKVTVNKYKDKDGNFLTNRQYNILRRKNLKKFNIPEDSMCERACDDVKLVLEDREFTDMIGLYADYYPEFGVKLNKVPEIKKSKKEPISLMPSFLCAKFGDKDTATVNNKSSGFQTNNENAFVLPSLAGITSVGFGSGKVYSVRVDNIDETINQEDFRYYMKEYGITNCKDMRLIMKKKKNRDGSFDVLDENRGFGFIEFFSLENAEEAVELLDRQRIGFQIISASVEPDKEL